MASISWADWVSMMGSFLVVLTLLVGTLIMIKKMGPKIGIAGNKRLQVIEVQNLGGRQKLVLVNVNQEQILIGISGQGMTRLGNFPNPPNNVGQPEAISKCSIPAAEETKKESSFQGILSRVLKK
jgi:flagellar biogenesis protein FliO